MGRRPYKNRPPAIKPKRAQFLTAGSTVEVSSADEGLEGAWYTAKILRYYRRKRKCLIQYHTLLASEADPNQPLTESVDISYLRPAPPPHAADQSYEVGDVVDAFHRDGWWKGIISKVVSFEGGNGNLSKYSVVFENPPEKFQFLARNLRFHSVWTSDGKWVRSPKRRRMAGLNYEKGMAVEVNFNRERSKDVWIPAVVVEEVGFDSFLVEYSGSGNDRMKETVDSFHIRPTPPELEVQNFEILESVEVFHDSCWKKGTIVATFMEGRYGVLMNSEKEMQFDRTEIRPHQQWINGKWVSFGEMPKVTESEGQLVHVDNVAKSSGVVLCITSSVAAEYRDKAGSSIKRLRDGISPCKDKSSVKKSRNAEKESNAFRKKGKGKKKNVSEPFTASNENAGSSPVTTGAHTDIERVGEPIVAVNGVIDGGGGNSNQFPAITDQADGELVKQHVLPFTKSSILWNHVYSLPVFRVMPQNPHFTPLLDLPEATREGFAVGQMLSFSILLDKISELQNNVPKEVLEGYLVALSDYKMHGFNVKAVADQVNKLLAIKNRQEQLNNESEELQKKIAKCDGDKAEIEEEITSIDKMRRVLETIRAMKLSKKLMLVAEGNDLRAEDSKINETILNLELEFQNQAAAILEF